jgi:hypothetical protein
VTPIQIAIPESLTVQKTELETTLAGIAGEEEKLAAHRKDVQVALETITTGIAILSGQTLPVSNLVTCTARKPMSAEARQRIAEGLRKSAQARAAAKAVLGATSEPQDFAPVPADALMVSAPETPVEVPADTPLVVSAPEEPAEAPADVPVPDSPRGSRGSRKGARA